MELPELAELKKKKRERLWPLFSGDNNAGGFYWSLRLRNHHLLNRLLKKKWHKAVGIGALKRSG